MLDTNFLIAALQPGSQADMQLRHWLRNNERLGVCSLVWAEFLCGPLTPAQSALADTMISWKEAFAAVDAPLAAKLFNLTGRRRGTMTDCMIAAVALRHSAVLATFNQDDFLPFVTVGLKLWPNSPGCW